MSKKGKGNMLKMKKGEKLSEVFSLYMNIYHGIKENSRKTYIYLLKGTASK